MRRRVGMAFLLAPGVIVLAHPCHWVFIGAGGVLVGAGLFLRSWAAGYIHKDRSLSMDGPYALCRHPLYLGSAILTGGILLVFSCPVRPWSTAILWLLFIIYFSSVYRWTVVAEEEKMARLFPNEWAGYVSRIPCFWPSRFFPLPEIHGAFSLEQWLHNREYNAILGALAVLGVMIKLKNSGFF